MRKYISTTTKDVDEMLEELEMIANMTGEAHETVVYMKDSVTSAQKASLPGNTLSFHKMFFIPIQLTLQGFIFFFSP